MSARATPLKTLVDRLEHAGKLDQPAEAVARQVRGAVPSGPVKDTLSGSWLGHALHPLLTDVPIGTWTSAGLLDVLGGKQAAPAAQRLTGIGVLAALPAAITGATDWADTTPASDEVRRVGAVHAIANTAALALYSASWLARRRGRRARGVAYGAAGAAILGLGGYLGGHLSYAQGVGVDNTVFDEQPESWVEIGSEEELGDGGAHCVQVGGTPVLVARVGGEMRAIEDRCSHRGGALHEGELSGGCIECPLHGSVFRLADGEVQRGPAAYPQPAYDVRVEQGRVSVRARA